MPALSAQAYMWVTRMISPFFKSLKDNLPMMGALRLVSNDRMKKELQMVPSRDLAETVKAHVYSLVQNGALEPRNIPEEKYKNFRCYE